MILFSFVRGVVQSKFCCGYVEVYSLGETLLFTQTGPKLTENRRVKHANIPAEFAASTPTEFT